MASPVITKALCDNGTWYSAVIILPHDDVFDVPLKLDGVNRDYSIPSRKGTSYPPMMGKLDAVSGFEEFISGDFKREVMRHAELHDKRAVNGAGSIRARNNP